METYVIALDQGTTSSRAILFNRAGEIVSRAQHPFRQIYPQPGWVEHDPLEIWATEKRALAEAVGAAHIDPKQIAAIGITNQRETTVIWDRATGQPVHNAIVWQCRRTAPLCDELKEQGLGPLVTDVAPGYDHITAAIGGAIAAAYGASFLCYVTPAEHLRLPNLEDVKEGIIASRIAAHAADLAKGIRGAGEWDHEMSLARKNLDWERMFELSIDPEKARRYRAEAKPEKEDTCSMCGNFCAVKNMNRILDGEIVSIFDE